MAARRLLIRFVSAALVDNPLCIPPLHAIIADYAEFVGTVRTIRAVVHRACQFRGILRHADGSVLVADWKAADVWRIVNDCLQTMVPMTGATSICADPVRNGWFFVTTSRHVFATDGRQMKQIADNLFCGQVDNHRLACGWIAGCAVSANGKTLYFTDHTNDSIRQIDTTTNDVTTVIRSGAIDRPRKIAIYVSDESVLYCTSNDAIYRIDIRTSTATTMDWMTGIRPQSIVCTAAGFLIFSCVVFCNIYSVDPRVGATERIAGTGRRGVTDGDSLVDAKFQDVMDMTLSDDLQRAWLVEDNCVRVVDLPPHLFYND